jgi:hypothetical protein
MAEHPRREQHHAHPSTRSLRTRTTTTDSVPTVRGFKISVRVHAAARWYSCEGRRVGRVTWRLRRRRGEVCAGEADRERNVHGREEVGPKGHDRGAELVAPTTIASPSAAPPASGERRPSRSRTRVSSSVSRLGELVDLAVFCRDLRDVQLLFGLACEVGAAAHRDRTCDRLGEACDGNERAGCAAALPVTTPSGTSRSSWAPSTNSRMRE